MFSNHYLSFFLFPHIVTPCECEKHKIVVVLKIYNQQKSRLVTNPSIYAINRSTWIHQDTVYSQNCVTNQREVTMNNRRNPTRIPAAKRRPTTLITEWVKFCYRFKYSLQNCSLYALHQWRCPILFAIADHTSIVRGHPHQTKRGSRIQMNILTGTHPRHDST